MKTPVSYELAKLLIQKSYDLHPDFKDSYPTIAEVVMWLYEKYGIWISVNQMIGMRFYINFWKDDVNRYCPFDSFNSPTEAYEAAIEYTLKNLI